MLCVPRKVLSGVALAAADGAAARYVIHGVLVEDRGRSGRATATDGKMLVRATFPAGDADALLSAAADALKGKNGADRVVADAKALRKVLKSAPKGRGSGDCAVACGEALTVGGAENGGWTLPVQALEGSFPHADGVVPKATKKDARGAVEFDAVLLRKMLDAVIEATGEDNDGRVRVRLRLNGKNAPLAVTASNKARKVGVLGLAMPMNGGRR